MKQGILVSAIVFLAMVGMAQAQEGELHGAVDLTFSSKYIWRGFDVYDDHAAIHPGIDLDLFGTGFGFNVVGHRANSSGFEDGERWDYTIYYQNGFLKDQVYATNYMIGYRYYNFPDSSSHTRSSTDLQEIHTIFSWPNILPVEGLVPSYCLVKLWPGNSGTAVGNASPTGGTASGVAHIFMLDYGLTVLCPLTGQDRILKLHSEFIFNDGVDPRGIGVDHDWSNAVFGVSTDFDLGNNLTFTPAIYYQSSWDDSVNNENEAWVAMSLTYKF